MDTLTHHDSDGQTYTPPPETCSDMDDEATQPAFTKSTVRQQKTRSTDLNSVNLRSKKGFKEVFRVSKERNNDNNNLIGAKDRIDIIYLYEVHGLPQSTIAKITKINYSTVRTIVSTYQRTGGRINKLLTYMTKKVILDKRQKAAKNLQATR